MYRWTGDGYKRTWVEHQEGTHAKEILCYDVDGDGTAELFSVLEAELDADKRIAKPVEIREYTLGDDGNFGHYTVGTIADRQTHFLVPADFDGDGHAELIAAAFRTGLYYLTPPSGGNAPGKAWTSKLIDDGSSGFEHAAYAADLDDDGRLELYVAADDQGELSRYDYTRDGKFRKRVLGKLDKGALTWNITTGEF